MATLDFFQMSNSNFVLMNWESIGVIDHKFNKLSNTSRNYRAGMVPFWNSDGILYFAITIAPIIIVTMGIYISI